MTDSEFAKTHLRDHLSSLLIPPVAEGFWSIQTSAKELCERNNQPDQILRTFQNLVTKIPEWSDSTLATEVERIETVSKCTYLDDLIMGVFISYMKSFASLHYKGGAGEIEIDFERPSLSKFVHELYIHSARKLWQTAYLLNVNVTSEVQARNRQEVEKIIAQCLEQVIRAFLPWKTITQKYFKNSEQAQEVVKHVEEEESKTVKFEDSDEEEEEEDKQPKLTLSDEDAKLDFVEEKSEESKPELVEEDAMKELEKKVSETLVLNL